MHYSPFILLVAFVICSHGNERCKKTTTWIKNPSFKNFDITKALISSAERITSQAYCGIRCLHNSFCVWFSYNVYGTCRLHYLRFMNSGRYLLSPGWTHFYLSAGSCPVEDGFAYLDKLNLCFKVFTDQKNYSEARDACSQIGSRLISLDTEEKNTAVGNYIAANLVTNLFLYIGLTDEVTEDVYVWQNGVQAVFFSWAPGEPHSNNLNEDFVMLRLQWNTWHDMTGSTIGDYICEKPM